MSGRTRWRAHLGAKRCELGREAAQSPHTHHLHLRAWHLLRLAAIAVITVIAHLAFNCPLHTLHSIRQMCPVARVLPGNLTRLDALMSMLAR